MVGLGRMGANMTQRLLRGGHRVVGFDFNPEVRRGVEQHGAETVTALEALVSKLAPPRTLWLMVPPAPPPNPPSSAATTAEARRHGDRRWQLELQGHAARSLLFADKQ